MSKKEEKAALDFLHDVLLGKKKGQVQEYEQVMQLYVKVAVDLLALEKLREALSAYRNLIQHFSPASFQVIVETLLSHATEKADNAPTNTESSLLLSSVTPREETSQHKYRLFLWDVYGVILDLVKTNGKLVGLYTYTVESALGFCAKNHLKNECLKLAQALHGHLQGIFKLADHRNDGSQATLSYAIDLFDPPTSLALIQIRLLAIETLIEMKLLPAALQQAEDVSAFRLYLQSIPIAEEVRLWQLLSKWFFLTGHLALHAYLQQDLYWVTLKYRKTVTIEELKELKTIAVLSSLASSTYDLAKGELRRFMDLLKVGISPKRQTLLGQLKAKGLLEVGDTQITLLVSLLDEQFVPLQLVDSVRIACTQLEPVHQCYTPHLLSVASEIALKQLSRVYSTISTQSLLKVLGVASQSAAEKTLMRAILNGNVQAQVDQSRGFIHFNPDLGLSGFCARVNQVYDVLNQFQRTVSTAKSPALTMEQALVFTRENRQTKEKIDQAEKMRKERIIEQQQDEEAARKRELEARAKVQESSVQLKRKVDTEQQKQRLSTQRRQLYLEEIHSWVEKMKNEGFNNKEMKLRGRKIKEMTDEEMLEIGFEEFISLHKSLFDAAKVAREEQLQQESRQLLYTERAKREVEADVLREEWEQIQDTEVLKEQEQHKLKFEQDQTLRKALLPAAPFKLAFVQAEIEKAKVPFDVCHGDWVKSQISILSKSILDTAKELREEERKRAKEMRRPVLNSRLEQEAREKQEAAKRLIYEDSALRLKETKEPKEDWRTAKSGEQTPKLKFTNTKKPVAEKPAVIVPVKEEVKKAELPLSQTSGKWTRPESFMVKPVEQKPVKPGEAGGYRPKFSNKLKDGAAKDAVPKTQ